MGWQGESEENPIPPKAPSGSANTLIGVLFILFGIGWFIISVAIPLRVNYVLGCTFEESLSVIKLIDTVGSVAFVIIGAWLLFYSTKN